MTEVMIDFSKLDEVDPQVLSDLRMAVINKVSEHGIKWDKGRCTPRFTNWAESREQDEVEDVMDDLDTLVAIEKVLGVNKVKH